MNNITVFNFNQNQVRTQTIDSEPWFCLSDVCDVLNIQRCRIERLSADGWIKNQLIDKLGRFQERYFINEPNLYRLIFRSNKPQAQAFADWVYNEVLPSIRKTGGYGSVDVPALAKAVANELKFVPTTVRLPLDVEAFFRNCVELSVAVTSCAETYNAYKKWCQSEGYCPLTANKLGRSLKALGVQKCSTRRGEKAYRLALKEPQPENYRYNFTPVTEFCGAGVYKNRSGQVFQAIAGFDDKIFYTYFNMHTARAEGKSHDIPLKVFNANVVAKMTSKTELIPLDGEIDYVSAD
ncbi:MAG: hypothetical protein IJ184_06700 [Alphaproteobacteria bacterium]|nr:hypothetical protein [Alphaproteobacteria bacterium]